jgi:hypothetical protein
MNLKERFNIIKENKDIEILNKLYIGDTITSYEYPKLERVLLFLQALDKEVIEWIESLLKNT